MTRNLLGWREIDGRNSFPCSGFWVEEGKPQCDDKLFHVKNSNYTLRLHTRHTLTMDIRQGIGSICYVLSCIPATNHQVQSITLPSEKVENQLLNFNTQPKNVGISRNLEELII